jgi:hypothetical protein
LHISFLRPRVLFFESINAFSSSSSNARHSSRGDGSAADGSSRIAVSGSVFFSSSESHSFSRFPSLNSPPRARVRGSVGARDTRPPRPWSSERRRSSHASSSGFPFASAADFRLVAFGFASRGFFAPKSFPGDLDSIVSGDGRGLGTSRLRSPSPRSSRCAPPSRPPTRSSGPRSGVGHAGAPLPASRSERRNAPGVYFGTSAWFTYPALTRMGFRTDPSARVVDSMTRSGRSSRKPAGSAREEVPSFLEGGGPP